MTNMVPHIPDNAPFSPEQRAWLNGFLAGLFSRQEMQEAAGASAALAPLSILFGSQTGNAEALSKQLSKAAGKHGFAPTVYDMAEYPISNLSSDNLVLIITSTYGDGDPPDNAQAFWDALSADSAPSLSNVNYSVLALGDTNYEQFCQFGKSVDARMEQLGANRIFQRMDCDVDYDDVFEEWMNGVLPIIQSKFAESTATPSIAGTNGADLAEDEGYSKRNPFPASVKRVVKLNADGSDKDTRHVEISLAGSGLSYQVGDALGVMPHNNPDEADAIINVLGLDGNAEVKVPKEGTTTLHEALIHKMDISKITKSLLEWLLEKTGDSDIEELIHPDNKEQYNQFVWGREILDVLNALPQIETTPDELISNLKPLQPRLYSISSSPNAHPDEVHITVGVVQYDSHGRLHHGVCSGFLAKLVQEGSTVPVYISPSKNFGLPPDVEKPVIMVGPGTGIAPFRAFLEERRLQGSGGKNWLFFGNPHESSDFLYRAEIDDMMNEGVLTRLDTAFSRDQEQKVYVQNRMIEQAEEIYTWLQDGGYFYVCGDAKRMAKDVHEALHTIAQTAGGMSEEQAAEYINHLQAEKRYQRDVY